MNALGYLLAGCGGSAVLALGLSISRYRSLARRCAQGSLWLALGVGPVWLAVEIVTMWMQADPIAYSRAALLGRTIAEAMNFGTLVLPCAFVAGLALRRANAAASRRR